MSRTERNPGRWFYKCLPCDNWCDWADVKYSSGARPSPSIGTPTASLSPTRSQSQHTPFSTPIRQPNSQPFSATQAYASPSYQRTPPPAPTPGHSPQALCTPQQQPGTSGGPTPFYTARSQHGQNQPSSPTPATPQLSQQFYSPATQFGSQAALSPATCPPPRNNDTHRSPGPAQAPWTAAWPGQPASGPAPANAATQPAAEWHTSAGHVASQESYRGGWSPLAQQPPASPAAGAFAPLTPSQAQQQHVGGLASALLPQQPPLLGGSQPTQALFASPSGGAADDPWSQISLEELQDFVFADADEAAAGTGASGSGAAAGRTAPLPAASASQALGFASPAAVVASPAPLLSPNGSPERPWVAAPPPAAAFAAVGSQPFSASQTTGLAQTPTPAATAALGPSPSPPSQGGASADRPSQQELNALAQDFYQDFEAGEQDGRATVLLGLAHEPPPAGQYSSSQAGPSAGVGAGPSAFWPAPQAFAPALSHPHAVPRLEGPLSRPLWLSLASYHRVLRTVGFPWDPSPDAESARWSRAAQELSRRLVEGGGDDEDAVKTRVQANLAADVWSRLFDYQQRGVAFALRLGGRAFIADSMGLGKTIQSLATMFCYTEDWPLLVVAPQNVLSMWGEEAAAWAPRALAGRLRVVVVRKATDFAALTAALTCLGPSGSAPDQRPLVAAITTYELAKKMPACDGRRFGCVICDESHFLKSSDSQRYTVIAPIVRGARRALLLSGTPALNRPIELWTQLDMLWPGQFGSYCEFGDRYCERSVFGGYGGGQPVTEYKDAINEQELRALLEGSLMLRRHAGVDLPEKTVAVVEIPISDDAKAECAQHRAKLAAINAAPSDGDTKAAKTARETALNAFYSASGCMKVDGILHHVAAHYPNLLAARADGPPDKALVFYYHKNVGDALEARFASALPPGSRCTRIDGDVGGKKKASLVEEFQGNAAIRVALCSILAAGASVTMTAANLVLFAELSWIPNMLKQAEGRAHRTGQTRPVQVVYFKASQTCDEFIWNTIHKKMESLGQVLGTVEDERSEARPACWGPLLFEPTADAATAHTAMPSTIVELAELGDDEDAKPSASQLAPRAPGSVGGKRDLDGASATAAEASAGGATAADGTGRRPRRRKLDMSQVGAPAALQNGALGAGAGLGLAAGSQTVAGGWAVGNAGVSQGQGGSQVIDIE